LADTRAQIEVQDWVRDTWLPNRFGKNFTQASLPLESGGQFRFTAVSDDQSIAAFISTSGSSTASGKKGVGKLQKIRADMLFLRMTSVDKRLIVFTENDMYELCLQEKAIGRVSQDIEFELAGPLPKELELRLTKARRDASDEVAPR
jgi:hypothetical protein